jgi:hypothetical protein
MVAIIAESILEGDEVRDLSGLVYLRVN